MNRAIFDWINGWPDSWQPFFLFLSEGNKWWGVRILLLLTLGAMATRGSQHRWAILAAIIGAGLSNELTEFFKDYFQHMRPSAELTDINLRVHRLTSFGTVSSHAANMAAVATVMTLYLRKWGTPWIVLALFVGVSRIYVGVHYPYQVLLGWISGILVGFLVVVGIEQLRKRFGQRRHDTNIDEQTATP